MNTVILVSGNGSNLQAIIEAKLRSLKIDILAVISSNPSAFALQRAKNVGLTTEILSDHLTLHECINKYQPDLVVLAGFMKIIGKEITQKYKNKIVNIHPSLLPKYPGLNTHNRVLANGDTEHGCSIHFVTEELDQGPLIAQASMRIQANDSAETLKTKVQKIEHVLYPEVISWFANDRIYTENSQIFLDNEALPRDGKKFSFA